MRNYMKWILFALLCTAPMGALPAKAQLPMQAELPGIVVSGSGEVRVKPDIARISMGVVTRDKDSVRASALNAEKADALLRTIKALGVKDEDIQTAGYNISPEYVYPEPQPGKPRPEPQITAYQVSNVLSVTVRKLADTGRVIDAAVKAGANTAGGIEFDLNEEAKAKAYDEAMAKAVAQATRKVGVLAKAANVARYDLHSITESGAEYSPRPMMMARQAMMDSNANTPVAAGEQTVRANVTVRYTFAPAAK